jgi:hypothetical protein
MQRKGYKHGRIIAWSKPGKLILGRPALEPKEWQHRLFERRNSRVKVDNPKGVWGKEGWAFVLCPKRTSASFVSGSVASARRCPAYKRPVGKMKGYRVERREEMRRYYSMDWVLPLTTKNIKQRGRETKGGRETRIWDLDAEEVGEQESHLGDREEILGDCEEHLGDCEEHLGDYEEHLGEEHLGDCEEHLGDCEEHLGDCGEHSGDCDEHSGDCEKCKGAEWELSEEWEFVEHVERLDDWEEVGESADEREDLMVVNERSASVLEISNFADEWPSLT